jgi:hypothetical protein
MWWPKLETQIKEAEEKAKVNNSKDLRSERDLIEEVLSLTRELSINRRFERERVVHPRAIEDLITNIERLVEGIFENGYFELAENIGDLHRPIEYLIEESMKNGGIRKELYSRYRRTRMMLDDFTIPSEKFVTRVRRDKNDIDLLK